MFDTKVVKNSYHDYPKEINSKVTVTENKAPTDESLKILSEMQKKARESLISVDLENNEINFVTSTFEDPVRCRAVISYQILINGYKEVGEVEFPYFGQLPSPQDVRKKVTDSITKTLTEIFYRQSIESIVHIYRRNEERTGNKY